MAFPRINLNAPLTYRWPRWEVIYEKRIGYLDGLVFGMVSTFAALMLGFLVHVVLAPIVFAISIAINFAYLRHGREDELDDPHSPLESRRA